MAATSKSGAAARTRSVGTKLTEEEFARLESLAAATGQSVSEWARSALLAAATPTPTVPNPNPNNSNDVVLGEVRALRAIVLNLFFDLANGEEITVESVKEIIAKADAKKAGS
ncbi:MAG: ribbon-helix-helix protein, CopG family [Acidobacteria bacterium]|nr:ribbon-helix-helix protein, CopG family [Acidobacteriota bacterium]